MHYSITIHFHVIITNSTYFNRHHKFLLFLNGLTNKNTCKRIQCFTEFFLWIFQNLLHLPSFLLFNKLQILLQ
ncbi:MAG TPA: hypothetical protein DG757_23760 [Bacillus sp. (in: Bacteria)]|nr:hypothetical protein [Bacillus sp. (in: firmicutes)]